MSIIIVSGTLQQVSDSINRINEAVKNRIALGFSLFQHDEEWMFIGSRDEKECTGICRPLEHTITRGDRISSKFPYSTAIDETHLWANMHFGCRCILEFENVSETLRNRLHAELEATK